jgi:hypothetical protein
MRGCIIRYFPLFLPGSYWRINFSRVEWKVHVEDDNYVLGAEPGDCKCVWPCYPTGAQPRKPTRSGASSCASP